MYIHVLEYYLVTKRNEILVYVTTSMNLKNIRLTDRSQSQKATYPMSRIRTYEGRKSGFLVLGL